MRLSRINVRLSGTPGLWYAQGMKNPPVVILGCGFTGKRVADMLLAKGRKVLATSRTPDSLAGLASRGAEVLAYDPDGLPGLIPAGAVVLHSVPDFVGDLGPGPSRVVHLSTTGVYGEASEVDETTPAAPVTARQLRRRAMEEEVEAGPWPWLILRPAAIYGPGRGLQRMLREGRYRLAGDGSNYVSRIHVVDLARITSAALESDLTGAYPVADAEPAMAREVAGFVAGFMSVPKPESTDVSELPETLRASRRVDGSAIRRKLGVGLLYPTYREGFPAVLAAEQGLNG
jgi:nucleoside-diphosphate-sugar epimerase